MTLFQDHNGQPSMMRFQCFIVILAGIAYAFAHQDLAMTAMFFTYGFGGKAYQKNIEMKSK